jgi:enoyl-[acyl-carrier protein] reductase II
MKTKLCDMLGISRPVIQSPMTWITSAELAAAVCNAGGLGTLGPNAGQNTLTTSTVETGERLRREIQKLRRLTDKPFAVNLVLMGDDLDSQDTFGGACLKVMVEEKVPVVITAGFTPDKRLVDLLHSNGTLLFHREPNIDTRNAKIAEAAGIDALIAVGFDGGGHLSAYGIPTFTLIPLIADAVSIPVIAGGGIMDGRGVKAALNLGAQGVYVGTRFIASVECPAHPVCKQAILDATDDATAVLQDSLGLTVRVAKKAEQSLIELGHPGNADATESEMLMNTGGIYEGMLLGDVHSGTLSFSIASAMIHEIKTVEEIMADLVGE